MQVQYKLPRVMEGEFERVGELRADDYSIDEVEAVIVNRRVLEASAPRQFWEPHCSRWLPRSCACTKPRP